MKLIENIRQLDYLKTFSQVMFIFGFFFLGDWLHVFLNLPLPGSIIGLLLLLALLFLRILPLGWIETGANFLLSYLPLFLIPATVGAINYGHVFAGKGSLLILLVIISTLITMAISSHTSQFLARRFDKRKEKLSCKQ